MSAGDLGGFGPCLRGSAKIRNLNLQKRRLVILETNQSLVNHPNRSLGLPEIANQPERRRQLDQSFNKRLFRWVGFLIEGF